MYLQGGQKMITLNNEQLEFLKLVIQTFEYNDNAERNLIEQIETKIYNAQEKNYLDVLTGL